MYHFPWICNQINQSCFYFLSFFPINEMRKESFVLMNYSVAALQRFYYTVFILQHIYCTVKPSDRLCSPAVVSSCCDQPTASDLCCRVRAGVRKQPKKTAKRRFNIRLNFPQVSRSLTPDGRLCCKHNLCLHI